METRIKLNPKEIDLSKQSKLTKGNWFTYKKMFLKKSGINIFVDVLWNLTKRTKYQKRGIPIFPFIRDKNLKTFIINLLCVDFHEIVHIKMHEWKVENSTCENNSCSDGNCWWCDYTNYNLHWFFIEGGIEI